jgi:hypothetical protein
MSTLAAKLSAPRIAFPSIPATRELSRDINALEGNLRRLQAMRREIAPGPAILVMGPGRAGRDALESLNAPALLDELIRTYELAIADLGDQHTEADIAESISGMFAATGAARVQYRSYLRDLIHGHRETVGTGRAA